MKIALLTNEFPPNIYGGAGVHVDFLSRELRRVVELQVRCFGTQNLAEENLQVQGLQPHLSVNPEDPRHAKVFETLDLNLQMAASLRGAEVVHCHTWYSHFAGLLARTLYNIPLVLTTHSLEPHRPWKVEQLGAGYNLSTWIEGRAYREADGIIAVSEVMRSDVMDAYGIKPGKIRVIHNGIDLDYYTPNVPKVDLLPFGIDPQRPFVLFVGRITRQKGISEFIHAIPHMDKDVQVLLCAGAPDTPEIEKEVSGQIIELQKKREGIVWIREMLGHDVLRSLYAQAKVFACPSLYEPFGIINLEAMACGTPVVASAVGGIPEIVIDGETGFLVPLESKSRTDFAPIDPETFRRELARRINQVVNNSEMRKRMGIASRKRVEEKFSWQSIARQTLDFYRDILHERQRTAQG